MHNKSLNLPQKFYKNNNKIIIFECKTTKFDIYKQPKQEETTSDSVGNVLLKDFKTKVGSTSTV